MSFDWFYKLYLPFKYKIYDISSRVINLNLAQTSFMNFYF